MKIRYNHRAIAFALMRIALGLNLFEHGFFRILAGQGTFVRLMTAGMSKSPLPHSLLVSFGYCIPWIEVTLGCLLVAGLLTEPALAGGSLFMIALTFGTSSNQDWGTVGLQLNYSVVFFILLWLVEANSLSMDNWLKRGDNSHDAH